MIKPKLGDISINPSVYRNAIKKKQSRGTKGEFVGDYILFVVVGKTLMRNVNLKEDGPKR